MKVTKLGHCCLLIEVNGLRILSDPGSYSPLSNDVKDIDVILITHEHADHLHINSLKNIIAHTSKALIITNKGVGKILDNEGISFQLVEDGEKIEFRGVLIEGFGKKHAEMYKTLIPVDNTGYFINGKLFYPGDAFYHPQKPVEILALPVAGPWMKLSEAIDFALVVQPKKCFPVHDGGLKTPGVVHRMPKDILAPLGIEFIILEEGKEMEF